MTQVAPRSAYFHVPFCLHRCGYCNFTLVANRADLVPTYLEALELELASLHQQYEVDTLYFGGGTPTYLDPDSLSKLSELVLSRFVLAADYEWTVEANPGDLDRQRIEVLASRGVNRISLGVQSFDAEKLRVLQRDHDREAIFNAVQLAREANMRVSLDLMFAAPKESLASWLSDLQAAIELEPNHVSTYGLTFEQGTTFWNRLEKGELARRPEELEREMYLAAIDRLSEAGLEHYEISNFAQPNEQSRHNTVYWAGDPYFAFGPGAASYVDGARETNHRSTTTYLNKVLAGQSPVAERETLDDEQRARELFIFGLRRIAGVNKHEFLTRAGVSIEALAGPQIEKFVDLGLLVDDGIGIRLTREGLLVSDSLWPDFL